MNELDVHGKAFLVDLDDSTLAYAGKTANDSMAKLCDRYNARTV